MDKINMYMKGFSESDEICPISLEEIKDDSRALFQYVWYGKVPLNSNEKKILLDNQWTIYGDSSPKWKCFSKKYDLEMLYTYVVEKNNKTDPFTREKFSPYLDPVLRFKYLNRAYFLNKTEYKFQKHEFYAHLEKKVNDPVVRVNTQLHHLPFLMNATREITNKKLKQGEWLIRGSRVMGSMFFVNEEKKLIPKDGFYVLSHKPKNGKIAHLPFKHIHGCGYILCKYKSCVPVSLKSVRFWFPCITDLIMYFIKAYKLNIYAAVNAEDFIKRL